MPAFAGITIDVVLFSTHFSFRHPSESWGPWQIKSRWMPASAGMTVEK
jgi:hypothetical protein